MDSVHPATYSRARLFAECEIRFDRRSGPGGQNRNKVETAVILRHKPTGLSAEANEKRTQGENREEAFFRLRLLMALKLRCKREVPGELWKSRCRQGKLSINSRHEDFPAILAEALDCLEMRSWDISQAAEVLDITSSQLTKLLKQEPRAIAILNEKRKERGLLPLK